MSTMNYEKCTNCGSLREGNARFCGNCGNKFTTPIGEPDEIYSPTMQAVPSEIQQQPFTPHAGSFTERTYPPYHSFQPSLKLPPPQRSSVNIYRIIIVVLVVLLVGAVVYNFVRPVPGPNQSNAGNAHPIVNATTPPSTVTQAATTIPDPTATTGVTPTAPATATPLPAVNVGDILCQADATKGWDGWIGSSDWKILNGVLISDGTNNNSEGPPTIVAPCQLGGRANYAVETRIQVLTNSYPTCFGINVRGTSTSNGWQGYTGTVYVACNNGNGLLALNADNMNNSALASAPLSPGKSYHTYRIEVKDDELRFLVDGAQLLAVADNRYTSGDQVGLWSYDAQLNVSSFKVIAL